MLELTGEIADGALPLLFPPEHYFGVLPHVEAGLGGAGGARPAGPGGVHLGLAVDRRRPGAGVLAEKVAYYGHALSPLILARLGVEQAEFRPIEQAVMVERDMARA